MHAYLYNLWLGEVSRAVPVTSLLHLHKTRKSMLEGDGWELSLRASEEALRNLGAYQTGSGEWVLDCGDDGFLGCTVIPEIPEEEVVP